MSDPHEIDAIHVADEILKSQDDKEIEVSIGVKSYFQLASWFLERNDSRERVYTNPYVIDNIPIEAYQEHLFPRLAAKISRAPAKGLNQSGKTMLSLTYREIDAMALTSFYADPEFDFVTDEYRERMRKGEFDISMAFHAETIKHILLEIVESFVNAGGADRYGYLETFRRIVPMRVESFSNWEDDSVDLIEIKDDDESSDS